MFEEVEESINIIDPLNTEFKFDETFSENSHYRSTQFSNANTSSYIFNEPTHERRTMKEKISKIKFLLNKRHSSPPKFNSSDDKKKSLKQRNREASQRSRDKKKMELINLYNENAELKMKLDIYNDKINQLCFHCKCMFHHEEDSQDNYCFIESNTSASTNSFLREKIISFSLFALFCIGILCCCSLGVRFLNSSSPSEKFRSSLEVEVEAMKPLIKDEKKIHEEHNDKQYSQYTSIKPFPKILIDDTESKKSYYIPYNDILSYKNYHVCKNNLFSFSPMKDCTSSETELKKEKKKNPKESIYFKMFLPLCSNNEDKDSASFFEKEKEEQKKREYYYEVKCEVTSFTKYLK